MIKFIHRIGQGIFLRLENALNGVWGAASNPLYYLGGITYLMFWIIVVSGFYIFAFYDTGVEDAFNTVEQITHNQWYLGGIMRSLHRYASDGMILFAVFHLLRNFAFDRYRNFRWFSWYTGILVLWLTVMAGISGYWLPWDKLAQFVAVATAEWLDALPIFSAPLVRNFLEDGSVNDRFFTLLSLMHMGIPLGAFAVIWIHTQRVPNAKTSPPKDVTIGLILSMVALALIKPAVSQGHTNLDNVADVLNLDWFYLWAYPLLYTWNPAKVWGLVGGITGFLLLLPFLGRAKQGEYEITTVPCGHTVAARKGETILEAALHHGVNLPYVCREGVCGSCKGKILRGTVDYGTYQKGVLTEAEKAEGKALFCRARPLSDLHIECCEIDELGRFPIKTMNFTVQKMERAASDVMLLELHPEGGEQMKFIAGQYVAILLDDGTKRNFSIANAPQEADRLQLHIRLVPGGKFTGHVFNKMKEGDALQVEGPLGSFFLHKEGDKPIIFMCGGSGFGSIKGMLEYAFNIGLTRTIVLYWGARSPAGLYSDLPEKWQQEHANFKFIPVLSEPKPEDGWQGRTGFVHEAILQDYQNLGNCQVYACGSPEMVEAGRTPFMAKGLPEDQYFSDAFYVSRKAPAAEAPVSSEGVKHG
ncbi:MAG: cytochrome b N-terminal domain-containing protein [Nitrosomonadales bacterium]|nr:cytochrome b N-terminal domain-containing protein [Nitrosomonadales bacterium]